MTSEIRTNSLASRAGLSTVTMTDSGPMFSGITTFVDNSGFTFGVGAGSSIFTPASNTLTFGTNSNERFRIDSDGRLIIGGGSSRAVGFEHRLQLEDTNDLPHSFSMISNRPNAFGVHLSFAKSRGSTRGSNSVVQDDDEIATLVFRGADGTDITTIGAMIDVRVDGTPASNKVPASFEFHTRNASGTLAERLIINSAGHLMPGADSVYNIGSSSVRYANIYADTLYGDGSNLTNLSAGAASYNAVINGEMLVSQRGSDWTSVGSSAYHLDRWYWYDQNSSCRVRIRHSALSPDGFHQSYRVNCTTADTSIASNEEVKLIHKIEGYNLAPFAKGTSSAKKFTLSFYVKCNKTGTYCVELYDRDNGRDVSGSYTVSNTNWNRYTIDFPADTTGEFGFDNGSSLEIMFWLCAGSAVQGGSLNTSWRNSSDPGSATGQVNFMDSTSNEWALTGVQLEPTTTGTASDFKHEGLGETLSKCQRYYFAMCTDNYEILGTGHQYYSGNIFIPVYFPTTMRAEPTLEALAGSSGAYVYEKLFGNSPEYHHQISQETGKTGHNQSCIIMSGNNTRHGQTVRCAAHSFGSDTQRFVAFQAEL